jgi:hypothetical protein
MRRIGRAQAERSFQRSTAGSSGQRRGLARELAGVLPISIEAREKGRRSSGFAEIRSLIVNEYRNYATVVEE